MSFLRARVVSCLTGTESSEKGILVKAAPEPREVKWEALETTEEFEQRAKAIGNAEIAVIIIVGVVAITAVKVVQSMLSIDPGDMEPTVELVISTGMTGVVTLTTLIFNTLIRFVAIRAVKIEGQDTATEEQSSIFEKLSFGLAVNTVLVPLIVAIVLSNGGIGDQTWYEPGGIVSSTALLIVSSYVTDILIAVSPASLLKKHVLARFVYSPRRLRAMFQPEQYDIGSAYAYCLVMFALGLIYGPIYPPAYLLTGVGLAIKWMCTRFGLRHWFGVPPSVDQDMMLDLRWRLGQFLGVAFVVQCLSLGAASGPSVVGLPVFIGGSLIIFLYTIVPFGLFKSLARFDQLAEIDKVETTLTFDEAKKKSGPFDMPMYVCPKISTTRYRTDKGPRQTAQAVLNAVIFGGVSEGTSAASTEASPTDGGVPYFVTGSGLASAYGESSASILQAYGLDDAEAALQLQTGL